VNSSIAQAHTRPSADLIAELIPAANRIPPIVQGIERDARERDLATLDRLERLAEFLDGLRRAALMARESLRRELEESRQPINRQLG
jgi:hypothetical protein